MVSTPVVNQTPLNALKPPSTANTAPVMKLAASLHKNCTAPFSSEISDEETGGDGIDTDFLAELDCHFLRHPACKVFYSTFRH